MNGEERPPLDLSPAEWCVVAGCLIMIGFLCWCGFLLLSPVTP